MRNPAAGNGERAAHGPDPRAAGFSCSHAAGRNGAPLQSEFSDAVPGTLAPLATVPRLPICGFRADQGGSGAQEVSGCVRSREGCVCLDGGRVSPRQKDAGTSMWTRLLRNARPYRKIWRTPAWHGCVTSLICGSARRASWRGTSSLAFLPSLSSMRILGRSMRAGVKADVMQFVT